MSQKYLFGIAERERRPYVLMNHETASRSCKFPHHMLLLVLWPWIIHLILLSPILLILRRMTVSSETPS